MSMIIDIQHIPVEGKRLGYIKKAETFAVLRSLTESGECRFPEPLVIELTVVPERTLLRVDGVIKTVIEQTCSRCLKEFRHALKRPFTLRFARETVEDRNEPSEIELTEEHIGLTVYTGETIDFTDSVQEQVVLALPYKPLCDQTCKGLCPRCGTDLNTDSCGCAQDRSQNPFAVLKSVAWPDKRREK